ncbi:MAG TPA: hypothetical protein VEI47_00550 [Gemmatimonadales bacterium]|nr:hypothetical protein [Gemmatimonadales bacterium]
MPMRHLHHSDYREAFREVQVRQLRALKLVGVATPLLLLLWPSASAWKLPAITALVAWFVIYSRRNWRCPQCRVPLPYGRVPAEFTCPRCDALLAWVHRST